MSVKPNILFVYDHPKPEWWMDGLWAALNVLEVDFEVTKHNLNGEFPPMPAGEYDFTLAWGAFGSRPDREARLLKGKRGLCIAGNATPTEGANSYDVLFYETKWYRPTINFHPHIVHAFGVNTDLFNPSPVPVPVVWDYLGVGALADWKRWEKMAGKQGQKLVVGEYQPKNEQESLRIARHLLTTGVMVSNQVSPLDLVNLYHWSRTLYMPSDVNGGGERAVWEAAACGLNVEVEEDNPKLKELVDSEVKDHRWYAAQLKKGIQSFL